MIQVGQQEFAELLTKNKNVVWAVVNRYTDSEYEREDLFQDISLSAWRTFHLFRNECKFSTWLHRISVRQALNSIRNLSTKLKTTAIDNVLFEVVDGHKEYVEARDLYKYCISQLSDSEIKFVMMYAEGYDYEEMASVFGVNESNLRVRMNRIRQRLKKYDK